MSTLEDDFSDIVRKARFGLGLSLTEVARGTGMGEARLRALEEGHEPTAEEVRRLAAALGLREEPLRRIARSEYRPTPGRPPAGLEVYPVFAQSVGAWVYGLRTPDASLLIDCGGAVKDVLEAFGGAPQAVFLTHGHRDHVAALAEVPAGVPVYAHPALAAEIPGARPLADGEEVLGLRALHAPGHTRDMLALCGAGLAFVGDTLFAGSLGRAADAPSYPVLLESARRILALAPETVLYAGHGPVTTVGLERANNAFPVA